MKALYFCLLSLPTFLPASDKNEWTLKREKDGIDIYSRPSDYSKFNDIRVDMDLTGTIEQLAAVLRDVNNYTNWVYATRSSTLVINPANQSMNVVSVGMKDYQPEKKDLVRVPVSKGYWTVTTQSDRKIHLQYILQIDPGGSIPAWILNSFVTKAPIETFSKLKKKMEDLNR
jgi:hypothetical protein